jgi:type I restriction enzyme R subunit
MTKTDTSEKGLERLICTALTGAPCEPDTAQAGMVREPTALYGGAGWLLGSWRDYDREYCVDLVKLRAFLAETQPKAGEALDLGQDSPTRRKFLARLQWRNRGRG